VKSWDETKSKEKFLWPDRREVPRFYGVNARNIDTPLKVESYYRDGATEESQGIIIFNRKTCGIKQIHYKIWRGMLTILQGYEDIKSIRVDKGMPKSFRSHQAIPGRSSLLNSTNDG
jgi:hypothetical protein